MKNLLFEDDINPASEEYPFLSHSTVSLTYPAHFHREAELIHILEGSLTVSNESGSFRLSQGDFCLFLPGEIHSLLTETENRVCLMKLFVPASCQGLSGLRLRCNAIPPASADYLSISEIFSCILREDAERRPGYQAAVALQVIRLFLLVMRAFDTRPIRPEEQARRKDGAALLHAVRRYLDDHYQEDLTLDQVAAHCGYSKYYFSHRFRETSAMRFMDYFTLYRLQRAASALAFSSEKVIDIAYGAGFRNIRSFNRMFQKYFHLTPSAYRTRAHSGQTDDWRFYDPILKRNSGKVAGSENAPSKTGLP